jgi:hypothetical protein
MRADTLPVVLLVKAVEETDRSHSILPLADREAATRETLRELGFTTAQLEAPDAARRVGRALAERARRLIGPLGEGYPVLREILGRAHWPAWLSLALVALAFAAGVGLSALDASRRINILAFPFLGVIGWNLLVYVALGVAWLRRQGKPVHSSRASDAPRGGLAALAGQVITRPMIALARRTSNVHARLGEAVSDFAAEWARYSGPLVAARARRLLHLGSASVAVGLIAGLYLRGIVFRFEAGWESTFLEPEQVRRIMGLIFGPASHWSGVALPRTTEQVAALQWTQSGGGGDAAPWIHLAAITLAIYVVIPRLVLAAAASVAELRLRRGSGWMSRLEPYARRVLGAAGRGLKSAAVAISPYAYEPPPQTIAALQQFLTTQYGAGSRLDVQPMLHYGEEASAGASFARIAARATDAHALLFSLGATPESENHGLVLGAARDAVERTRPAPTLLVVVDETPYAARLRADHSLAARLEERRELWRRFVAGYGLQATFIDSGTSA